MFVWLRALEVDYSVYVIIVLIASYRVDYSCVIRRVQTRSDICNATRRICAPSGKLRRNRLISYEKRAVKT